MDWKIEVVTIPVSDVDRAKAFYAEKVGFAVDHDISASEAVRIVQLTPVGSACSIVLQTGLMDMALGSLQGLQLVVADVRAAHSQLLERGVNVSEVQVAGLSGFRPAHEEDTLDNDGFVFFSDPDGNRWGVQQIPARTP